MRVSEEQLGELGFSLKKAVKRVTKSITHPAAALKQVGKEIRKIDPIGGRILSQVGRDISNVRDFEKRVDKAVTKSKIGRGVLYAAGAIAAPFTGGWSLALTAAAIQKAKANASGKSIAAQVGQGVAAGAVGYAAGAGIAAAYGALTTPAALPGVFAGETATVPGTFTAAQVASAAASDAGMLAPAIATAPAVSAAASTAATVAASGGFLTTFGQSALVGLSLLKAVTGLKTPAEAAPSGAFDMPQYASPISYGGGSGNGGYFQQGGDSGTSPTGESTDPTEQGGQSMSMGLSRNTILVGGGILLAGVVAMSMRKQRRKV